MLVGYMRVSTAEQNRALQRDALLAAGIAPERIYDDTCSGAVTNRPGLARTLDVAREGDALVIWKPDRIGRSLRHIVELVHGKRGELRQRYREGQKDQLGALGLVVNVIVLWNTIYMDAALNQLRAEGFDVRPEDVARLSPLGFEHINMLGRYAFILPDGIARGELRPLRDPAAASHDEG